MPTHRVNLDALVAREDFESGETGGQSADQGANAITLQLLKPDQLIFNVLRKPDFQRATNNWTPESVVRLVEAFLDGMLIPSIIVWHSQASGKLFVIDGAHRLSALIAWVNEDYGCGPISRRVYGDTSDFKKFHEQTKTLMESRVGTYANVLQAGIDGGGDSRDLEYQKKVLRGRKCNRAVSVQIVEGPPSTAEASFVAINENPVPIETTELSVIKARRKPNVIATRALMRAGSQYYSHLPRAAELDAAAKEAYGLLFGQVLEIDTQSADVPRAGKPYSQEAFRMVLDMVNRFNGIGPAMWQQVATKGKARTVPLADETDGRTALGYLKKIKEVAAFVSDNGKFDSGSLGLDMAVYAYGDSGKFSPAGFLAVHEFALSLKDRGLLHRFTNVRKAFEDFVTRHQNFINQLGHIKGSRTRPLESAVAMYTRLFESIEAGALTDEEIVARLKQDERLAALQDVPAVENTTKRRKFSRSVQEAGVVRATLQNRERCPICQARLPPACRSKDHTVRVQDDGTGSLSNLQFTHPYCNTGYKESQNSTAQAAETPRYD